MAEVKRRTSSGWEAYSTPLTTDVTDTRRETFPTTIEPGDWPLVSCMGMFKIKSNSLASSGMRVTIPAGGTYRIKWLGHSDGDDAGTSHNCAIMVNGAQVGGTYTYTINSEYTPTLFSVDMALNKGDVVEIYSSATKDWNYYYGHVANLQACIRWEPYVAGFTENKALNHTVTPFEQDCTGFCTTRLFDVPQGCTSVTIDCGEANPGFDCLIEYGSDSNYLSYWGASNNPRTFDFDYPNDIKYVQSTFNISKIGQCYIRDNTHGQYIFKGSDI